MLTFLFVCTGNICRSPVAEAFMADRSRRLLGGAVRARSAGTWAGEGSRPIPEAVAAARELGVDASGVRSTPLDERLVEEADLVVTMTGDQRQEVADLVPGAAARTFTLKELAGLLRALPLPPAAASDGAGPLARIGEAHRLRREPDAPAAAGLDVRDPLGMPTDAYRAVAFEIEAGVDALVAGLFGPREQAAVAGS